MERDLDNYRKVKAAITYPFFILSVAAILTLILCLTVLPEFSKIFESLKCPLPWPTALLLTAVQTVQNPGFWMVSLSAVVTLFHLLRVLLKTQDGRFRLYYLLHRVPVVGAFLKYGALSRLSHAAYLGLDSGMDLIQTLRVAGEASLDPVVQLDLNEAVDSISRGLQLSEHMRLNPGLYDPTIIHLLAAGEEAANLAGPLEQASRFYQSELNFRTQAFTKLIEPILLFFVAFVVGGILLAIFLPLYSYLGQL
jgi:type II secretory pathway component PulF